MADEEIAIGPYHDEDYSSLPGAASSSPLIEPSTDQERTFAKRWGHEELFHGGYVGVPSGFLQLYARLNPPLTPGEAMFVIHLMQYKWDEKAPFPSYKTVARQMGVSDKMTRRHAQALELKKYLRRVSRTGSTNRFDLTPLFDALLDSLRMPRAKAS